MKTQFLAQLARNCLNCLASKFQTARDRSNSQTFKSSWLAVALMISGCSSIGLPSFNESAQDTQKLPKQQNVVADFENKIAEKLISELPSLPSIASKAQVAQFSAAANKVVHHSGINLNAVSPATQRQLATLKLLLAKSRYDVDHWLMLQHLAGIEDLLTQVENPQDQDLSVQTSIDSSLIALQENLDLQERAGYRYPTLLVNKINSAVEDSLQVHLDNFALRVPIFSHPSNAKTWMRFKLDPMLSETERVQSLELVKSGLEIARLSVKQSVELLGPSSLSSLYADSYFDVRREMQPEQTALDLLSVYLEEMLHEMDFKKPVALTGSEIELVTLHKVILPQSLSNRLNNRNTHLAPASHTQSRITLSHLLKLPAFEYQSLTSDITSAVTSNPSWPANWRQSLELMTAKKIERYMMDKSAFAPESELGSKVRLQTFYELALAELMIADGQWDLEKVYDHLGRSLPYNDEQLDLIVADWMAKDGSFAVAATLLESARDTSLESTIKLSKGEFPENTQTLARSLKAAADSVGS